MSMPENESITDLDVSSMSRKEYHLQSWKASGQNISEYCKENSLAQSTLRNWVKTSKTPNLKFTEIKTTPHIPRLDDSPKLIVKLGTEMKLYFHSVEDVRFITKLLKELS